MVLAIYNTSSETHTLMDAKFNQNSSAEFDIECNCGTEEEEIKITANSKKTFEVTCKPLIVGKTTQKCMFYFDGFVIGRELCIVGQSGDANDLISVQKGLQSKQQVGGEDMSRILTDKRRVRGNQTVRMPLFLQQELPLNNVPIELYKILEDQDEAELCRRYPGVLHTLTFGNYHVRS